MIDFLQTAFIFLVLMFMAYGCWVSTVMLSERSRLRKITGQYYDYEIEQELKKHTKSTVKFTFNPHLLPTFRGILTCIYLELNKRSSSAIIRNELIRFYKKNIHLLSFIN